MRTIKDLWDNLEKDMDTMNMVLKDIVCDQKTIIFRQKILIVMLSIIATAAIAAHFIKLL